MRDEKEISDVRVRRSREAVLAAAHALMSEGGIVGVSVDEVSRRSGVAKTTIYRHWPTRSALMLEACAKLSTWPPTPKTGNLESDLKELTAFLVDALRTARWPVVYPSIVDAAEHDPEMAELEAGLHAGLMAPYVAAIDSAKRRGELRPEQNASDLAAGVIAPLFYRRWFSREPIDAAFGEKVVDEALAILTREEQTVK